MLNTRPLSRRTTLKASGAGALALLLPPSAWSASADAATPAEAPSALRRTTWSALLGESVGIVDGPQLRVDEIRDLNGRADLVGRDDAFAVTLSAPAGAAPDSGLQAVRVAGDAPTDLFIGRVGPSGSRVELELVVDRTITLGRAAEVAPAAPTAPEMQTSGAAPGGTVSAAAPTIASIASGRLRVRTTATRTAGGVALRLEFPGGGLQAVKLRLFSGNRKVAVGGAVVRRGVATTTLRVKGDVPLGRGTYRLELQVTDHAGVPTTIERAVKLR